MKKVIRDGKVAVIISPGFGAGWFTWNTNLGDEILFDPRIVKLIEAQDPEIGDKVEELYPEAYTGGLRNAIIEWVDKGAEFQIEEYDGSESIKFKNSNDWIKA